MKVGDKVRVRIIDTQETGWAVHFGHIYDVKIGPKAFNVLVTPNNTELMKKAAEKDGSQRHYMDSYYFKGMAQIGKRYAKVYISTNGTSLSMLKEDEVI